MNRHRWPRRRALGLIASAVLAAGCAGDGVYGGGGRALYDEGDRSLTVEQYVEQGVPSPDRGWTEVERNDALLTLDKLAGRHADQLPRLDSDRSAALFNKMVNNDRLGFLGDTSIPPQVRLSRLFAESSYELALFKVYGAANRTTGMYGDELALLLARGVWSAAREVDLDVALIRDGQPLLLTDPANELGRLHDAIARLAVLCAQALSNRQGLGDGARGRLAAGIREPLATLAPEMSPLARTEVRGHLRRAADGEPDPTRRAALDGLIAFCEPQLAGATGRLDAAVATRPVAPRGAFNWTRYDGPQGARFSAEFPGAPTLRTTLGGGSGPLAGVVYTGWARASDGVRYVVMRRRLATDVPADVYLSAYPLQFARDAVVADRTITVDGMPAREVEFRAGHVGIGRAVASGGDMTEIYVESTGGDLKALRAKADRFFGTVHIERLRPPGAPGTPPKAGGSVAIAPAADWPGG